MIRAFGDLTEYDQAFDDVEAFVAYIEDPEADLVTTLAIEELHRVVHA